MLVSRATFLENPDANCIHNSPLMILLPYGGSCAITDFLRDVYADLILSLLINVVFFRYKYCSGNCKIFLSAFLFHASFSQIPQVGSHWAVVVVANHPYLSETHTFDYSLLLSLNFSGSEQRQSHDIDNEFLFMFSISLRSPNDKKKMCEVSRLLEEDFS